MTQASCLCKHTFKFIFTLFIITGVSGLIYYSQCDCSDLIGCADYNGEITCPSFGGDECEWNGNQCVNTKCVCCNIDITQKVITWIGVVSGAEGITGIFTFLWWIYQCHKDEKKVEKNHFQELEMDSYE